MIIKENGIKLSVSQRGHILTIQVLEQTDSATEKLQSVQEVRDPKTGLAVRSNRFPCFNQDKNILYLRGLESKKNEKEIVAEFANDKKATEAVAGIQRIVGYLTDENFEDTVNNNNHGQILHGGTSHCRFHFINRNMAKILCLTGHNHYPIKAIGWTKSNPVRTKNANYNNHIAGVVNTLNSALMHDKNAENAANKIRQLFNDSFATGPNELVACWRTITGFRDCDVAIGDNLYTQNGGTLKVRNAFLTLEMAEYLKVKMSNQYSQRVSWTIAAPIVTNNKHYDEHIGQVVDVLNKAHKVKEYSDGVVNHHRVGTKSASFVVKLIRQAINDAYTNGYLLELWKIMTGLRGPDFVD